MDQAGGGGPDPVEHVAAEAQRLAAAVTDWVRCSRQGSRQPEPGTTRERPVCDADPVCGVCPVCRGAALVRSLSPEVIERVADLAGMAAESLAAMAAARRSRADGDGR